MSGALPSPRRIAGALAVLATLPAPALAALAERLIDRLDALDAPGMDLERDDDDCCPAGDDDAASSRPLRGVRGLDWRAVDLADGEAEPHQEGPWWTPAAGKAGCGPVRSAMNEGARLAAPTL